MRKDVKRSEIRPKYRADIDGLRAIAVLAVVAFHAFPEVISGGFVGVDIFFVISGYLISSIIFNGLEQNNFSFIDFYCRRVRRIFPTLVTVLFSCLGIGWFVLLTDEYLELGKHSVAATGFISNLILWSESGYFDSSADTKILLHLWSLGIEEQFYLVWPILIWGALKLRVNWLILIAGLFITSFALNIYGVNSAPVATFYSPQTRFWELLIGALLAYLALHNKWYGFSKKNLFDNFLSLLGISLIGASLLLINKSQPYPGFWGLLPTLGAVFLLGAGPKAWFNRFILSNLFLVWIGLISFPLYLWHWPVLTFARILESQTPILEIRVTAVFVSIILAWLTYYFVERPLRFGAHNRLKTIGLIAVLMMISSFGLFIWNGKGLKFRDPTQQPIFTNQKNEQLFQEGCTLNFQNIPKTHCAEINTGKDLVLIVGDSHVRHWFEVLKEKITKNELDVIALSKGGCPFLLNAAVPNVPECIETNAEVLRYIENNQNRIKAILLAGQYETYLPEGYLKDSQGNNLIFSSALQNTIKKLGNHKIIFLDQIPPIPFEPKKCINRPYKISTNNFECRTKKSEAVAELSLYKSQRDLGISTSKNVSIFNADDALCDKDYCNAMDANLLLYYDKTHLNPNGVKFVKNKIYNMQLPLD
jgi:peptidoglycan/LPS O-acetylase OafA/YrhL